MDTSMSLRDRLDLADRTLDDRALGRLLADIHDSPPKDPPLVDGGQGHDADDVRECAFTVALLMAAAMITISVAWMIGQVIA